MTDDIGMDEDYIKTMLEDASALIGDIQNRFHGQAIPAVLAAIATWAVEYGCGDMLRDTLTRINVLIGDLEAEQKNRMN